MSNKEPRPHAKVNSSPLSKQGPHKAEPRPSATSPSISQPAHQKAYLPAGDKGRGNGGGKAAHAMDELGGLVVHQGGSELRLRNNGIILPSAQQAGARLKDIKHQEVDKMNRERLHQEYWNVRGAPKDDDPEKIIELAWEKEREGRRESSHPSESIRALEESSRLYGSVLAQFPGNLALRSRIQATDNEINRLIVLIKRGDLLGGKKP